MAEEKLLLKIFVSIVCILQIISLLTITIISALTTDNLSWLNLIQLIFPLICIVAIWRYNSESKYACFSTPSTSFLIIYIVWTVLSFVFAVLLAAYRKKAFVANTAAFETLFGTEPELLDDRIIIFGYILIAVQVSFSFFFDFTQNAGTGNLHRSIGIQSYQGT